MRIHQKIKTIKGRNDTSGTKTSRLGGGGQSVVYKCETNDESSDLSKVVIKMYMRPWEVETIPNNNLIKNFYFQVQHDRKRNNRHKSG